MPSKKNKIIAIVGPTATGKSDLAVFLAKKFDGEIVSADSRQIYTGLDIGSGKVTKKEIAGIPHHMLDIAHPKRTYSVAQYQKRAQKEIGNIIKRNLLPILCGGTGFYIQSVLDNISLPSVSPNLQLRKKLAKEPLAKLYATLEMLDPERAATIDQKNPLRLIRALEIVQAQGKVGPRTYEPRIYDTCTIGLRLPQDVLAERIHIRLHKRLKKGMVREVEKLHQNGLSWKRLESLGLEYRFVAEYLQNKMSRDEMTEKLEIAINQYAKRQMTWFKKDSSILWFTPEHDDEIAQTIKKFLER